MQVASEMLDRGNMNMAAISAEIGYESEAAFSRSFKRMMGVTPSAWRQGLRPAEPQLLAATGRSSSPSS
jgi:AraC-like DNA-binding protein